MSDSRWERLAPLTGVVFVVLLAAGVLVINNYDFLPPAEEIRSFYEEGSSRVLLGSYLALLSVFFFLWFVGSLRSRLRIAEGGTGRLSAVAFGGGVAAGATMIVGYAAVQTAAVRAGTDGGISAETATGLFDFSAILIGAAVPVAFAVLVGATAAVAYRTDAFFSWFGEVSVIIAFGLLTPLGFIFIGIALVWVLVVSIFLSTTSDRVSHSAPGER